MNKVIQNFLVQNLPECSPIEISLDEDDFWEWVESVRMIACKEKNHKLVTQTLMTWCNTSYEAHIQLINELMVLLAVLLLKQQSQVADKLIQLIKELFKQDVNLTGQCIINVDSDSQDSPQILKCDDLQSPGMFTNLFTLLKCKDKKK